MMYPFLTLDDSTEIVHSQTLQDGNVKVYIEKPDEKDGFHHATCFLPEYRWIDIFGFSDTDIQKYQKKYCMNISVDIVGAFIFYIKEKQRNDSPACYSNSFF